jgi:FKBP-type peptidyl-prolyl cis-trans isomerase
MAAVALLGQACIKEPENEADKHAKKNGQEIQKFLADSSFTDKAQQTPSGVYYIKTLENPSGVQPQTGSQVYVHYQGRRLTDNFLFDQSSRANNRPLVFALNNGSVIAGFNEGIAALREGEKAKLLIPSSLGYGYANLQNLPPYTTLKFDVELVAVRSEDQALRVFATDTLKLDPTQLQAVTSVPGVYYVRLQEGPGVGIQNDQKVNFKYRGRLIDGRDFAKANSTGNFVMGRGNLIKGVEETTRLMKVGEKGVIFIPSSHGYGKEGLVVQGSQVIPPYAPLIFDMEVVSVE